jgi:hypothetical protein
MTVTLDGPTYSPHGGVAAFATSGAGTVVLPLTGAQKTILVGYDNSLIEVILPSCASIGDEFVFGYDPGNPPGSAHFLAPEGETLAGDPAGESIRITKVTPTHWEPV